MDDPIDPQPNETIDTIGWETYALLGSTALVGIVVFAALFLDIPGWIRGDTDLFGNYRYEREVEQRRREFTRMERVHAELFPQWLVLEARPSGGRIDGKVARGYEKLRSKLSDEKLRGVVEDLRELMQSGKLVDAGDGVVEAMDRWNGRLEELDEPFFIRLRTARRRSRSFVYGGFYRRLAQPRIELGGSAYQALLLRRIDNTNLYESFLGLAREDAPYAFVVTDRVLDFALEDVLPVVAAGVEAGSESGEFTGDPKLDAVSKSFERRVRRALHSRLGESTYAELERAARARVRLMKAVESIRSRSGCSNYRIVNPPWRGYRARTLDRLDAVADRDKLKSCPAVEYPEADAIRAASTLLRREATESAFESMVALLTRMIAIHEVRHRADNEEPGQDPTCEPCPKSMAGRTASELSAYLASFAWSEDPSLALFQACKSRPSGAHRRALATYLEQLGTLCDGEIPGNLRKRSREIEKRLFGRSEAVKLPEEYPERLDLRIW